MRRQTVYDVSNDYDYPSSFYASPSGSHYKYYLTQMQSGSPHVPTTYSTQATPRSGYLNMKFFSELPWVIVIIQTIVIVSLLLLFFGYVVLTTKYDSSSNRRPLSSYSEESSAPPESLSTPIVTLRKLPKFTTTEKSQPIELTVDLVKEHSVTVLQSAGTSSSSEEPLFKHAAVVSNDKRCSDIGSSMLVRGGNSVDASISTLFCLGVTQPQSSGLGGGMVAVYCTNSGECHEINARETAPSGSSKNMFAPNPSESTEGYRSIAVPGELNGMWRMFERFGSGKVSWYDVVWPSVELARRGIRIGRDLGEEIQRKREKLMSDETTRHLFVNPRTAELYYEGDVLSRIKLAETLQQIAESDEPADLFYRDEMAELIVREVRKNGGLLTRSDLEDFEADIRPSVCNSNIDWKYSICGPRAPSSFPIVQLIVAVMQKLYQNGTSEEDLRSVQYFHRLIEAQKFAFAQRTTMGDPTFTIGANERHNLLFNQSFIDWIVTKIPENAEDSRFYGKSVFMKPDHGTSHVSVIDEYGGSISVTSSINLPFGSLRVSKLGFVYNSQMDSFSIPNIPNEFGFPSAEPNYIQPGKTPMSSMSPLIVIRKDTNEVVLSLGGTGGSRIIPSVASTVIRTLLFETPFSNSVNDKLIFSQYVPENVVYEDGFDKDILSDLSEMGHQIRPISPYKFSTFGVMKTRRGIEITNDTRSNEGGAAGY